MANKSYFNTPSAVANIFNLGVAPSNRFRVEFGGDCPVPMDLANRRFSFTCEAVQLPGKRVETYLHKTYGPQRRYAYNRAFTDEMSMTFRLGKDMFERLFFEFWHNNIIDPNTNDVGFYNNYTCSIIIYCYDKNDNLIYATEIREAYPLTIDFLDYSHLNTDQFMTQLVTFAYRETKWVIIPGNDPNNLIIEGDLSDSLLQSLSNNGSTNLVPTTGIFAGTLEDKAVNGKVTKGWFETYAKGSIFMDQSLEDRIRNAIRLEQILNPKSIGIIPPFFPGQQAL